MIVNVSFPDLLDDICSGRVPLSLEALLGEVSAEVERTPAVSMSVDEAETLRVLNRAVRGLAPGSEQRLRLTADEFEYCLRVTYSGSAPDSARSAAFAIMLVNMAENGQLFFEYDVFSRSMSHLLLSVKIGTVQMRSAWSAMSLLASRLNVQERLIVNSCQLLLMTMVVPEELRQTLTLESESHDAIQPAIERLIERCEAITE